MADWSNPTITSNYVTFVDEVKNRDIDSITLSAYPLTNAPVNSIRLLRTPLKFQQWDGSAYVDLVLSIAGGGTGSNTPGGAGTALGLGTMAYQNANAVAVTGGSLTNISIHGPVNHWNGTLVINENPSHGLVVYGPPNNAAYTAYIVGSSVPNHSTGLIVQAGYTAGDWSFHVRNRETTLSGIHIRGDMVAQFPYRLVIPVGTDAWAPV
jgi:hypothetical protein